MRGEIYLVDQQQQMADHVEIVTTIDPLNLAVTAKTAKGRIFWWFVTASSIVALIVAVTLLVNSYEKKATTVITTVKNIYLFIFLGIM